MRFRGLWPVLPFLTGTVLSLALGCQSKAQSTPEPLASTSAGVPTSLPSTGAVVSASASPEPVPVPTSSVQLPQGPMLAIQAGRGVGPIRLGATVATINRLMEAPCEVQTPEVCRYIVRGVEFWLDKNGVTNRIVAHRHERPAGLDAHGQPQVYGFFNGAIPPGAGLGMVPKAVLEFIGKPIRSERVTVANPNHTLDRDYYPGMILEYDEYTNGKVMLGSVIITSDKK